MTKCVECGVGKLVRSKTNLKLEVGDVVVVGDVPALVCDNCEATDYGVEQKRFQLHAARALAQAGVHTGDAFRHTRKALGLSGPELAKMLNVSEKTISRWENGEFPVDRPAHAIVVALVMEQLAGQRNLREALETLQRPVKRPPSRIQLKLPGA